MPTAIVTRATVGLGPALSLALAEEGWRLVLDGQEPRPLEAQAAGLATATEVVALPGDVCDAGHREA
ncbi:MAG: short-chain dehydrogenase, partial [Solirubrobacteraceae bacterium]